MVAVAKKRRDGRQPRGPSRTRATDRPRAHRGDDVPVQARAMKLVQRNVSKLVQCTSTTSTTMSCSPASASRLGSARPTYHRPGHQRWTGRCGVRSGRRRGRSSATPSRSRRRPRCRTACHAGHFDDRRLAIPQVLDTHSHRQTSKAPVANGRRSHPPADDGPGGRPAGRALGPWRRRPSRNRDRSRRRGHPAPRGTPAPRCRSRGRIPVEHALPRTERQHGGEPLLQRLRELGDVQKPLAADVAGRPEKRGAGGTVFPETRGSRARPVESPRPRMVSMGTTTAPPPAPENGPSLLKRRAGRRCTAPRRITGRAGWSPAG